MYQIPGSKDVYRLVKESKGFMYLTCAFQDRAVKTCFNSEKPEIIKQTGDHIAHSNADYTTLMGKILLEQMVKNMAYDTRFRPLKIFKECIKKLPSYDFPMSIKSKALDWVRYIRKDHPKTRPICASKKISTVTDSISTPTIIQTKPPTITSAITSTITPAIATANMSFLTSTIQSAPTKDNISTIPKTKHPASNMPNKLPAKKTPAKKTPAKKPPAKKAPAIKTPPIKTAAKNKSGKKKQLKEQHETKIKPKGITPSGKTSKFLATEQIEVIAEDFTEAATKSQERKKEKSNDSICYE